MHRFSISKYLSSLFLLLISCFFSFTAYAIECGDEIGPGGHHTLDKDLKCYEWTTVIGPTSFDMNGHTITAYDELRPDFPMLVVRGKRAKVFNGKLVQGNILLSGDGYHRVSGLTISEIDNAIDIYSSHNRVYGNRMERGGTGLYTLGSNNIITNNTVVDSWEGFRIESNNNLLFGNKVKNSVTRGFNIGLENNFLINNRADNSNEGPGFHIWGTNTRLILNRARSNNESGFVIRGEKQYLLANRSEMNEQHGFEVEAVNSQFLRNVSIDNGSSSFDMYEANSNCDQNRWQRNRFYTANQDCID